MVTPSGNETDMTIESKDCTEATTPNTQMDILPTQRPTQRPTAECPAKSTSLPEDQTSTENSTVHQAIITPGSTDTFSSFPPGFELYSTLDGPSFCELVIP